MAAKTVPTVTTRSIKNSSTGIDMHVLDAVTTHSNGSILYQIVVVTNLAEHKGSNFIQDDVVHFVVKHDYGAFEGFYSKLSESYPASILPPLPGKAFIATESTIKKRKRMLNALMEFIASSSKLSNCEIVQQFLGVKDKRQTVATSRPVDATDNHPLSQNFEADDNKTEIKEDSDENKRDDDNDDLFGSSSTKIRSGGNFSVDKGQDTNFGNYDTRKDTGDLFAPTSEHSEQAQDQSEETTVVLE
ncbi:uncharacterized protein TRIADDRAFT_52092 [Trichoplax adhaerens]|uniref:PX domain-containing protein n=1 Tax=Trichoplax adhaerens TaxID=10228 RepID=B3RLR3_TRIAD|nr:hypothetical protein TRIADDRAFT_52092 [Trichoplax adhaerens]EDV28829.1 hypothetical protein TRIADDRAFT_52092 [Trichoplax adhaerens]|eukprot:XP_002108031.1 hypothetical protein TRIADDRAFT_52092 [Trichoplax adhaerens]